MRNIVYCCSPFALTDFSYFAKEDIILSVSAQVFLSFYIKKIQIMNHKASILQIFNTLCLF